MIDDQPVMSMLMDMLLKSALRDIEIDQVEGGSKGLELLRQNDYQMILLDVNLPHYSIYDLIPAIREVQKDIKILVFTASPDEELAKSLRNYKVQGFVGKSASKDETIFAVKTVLHGGRYFSSSYSH